MSVWIRRGGLALAGLVLLLVVVAAWFVLTFDANRYKGVAVDWMKTNHDRTLVIAGPVELSVFPRLAVELSKASLSEAGKPDVFVAIDEAGLAVDLLPLLRGDVVIGRVKAQGVRVSYLRDAKGRSNIDDLLKPSPDKPKPGAPQGKPVRFDVSAVDLADVRARVKDDVAGIDGELLLKHFKSGRLADRVEAPVELAAQFDLKKPALKGELSGNTRLWLDTGSSSLALRQLHAHLGLDRAGQPVVLDVDWPELSVSGDKIGGSAFSGRLSRGGAVPVDLRFKSTAPSGNFDVVRLPGFEAQLTSNAPQRKLDGTLRGDLTLKLREASLALDKLELQAKVEEPKSPALGLAVRGKAVASAQQSSWNVAGQLNENRFSSEGSANLAGSTPHIVAQARFDTLDLNKLMSADEAQPQGPARPGVDAPIDMSALSSVNGRFTLQAGRFVVKQYRVDNARIVATLDNGLLRLTQLQGQAWGGQLGATGFADARTNRVGMKGAADGVNVNALLKDVAAKDSLEGTGRVSFDLSSSGRTVNQMKSQLDGQAALQVRDGAIKGINLAKTLRQAKAALGRQQDAVQQASATEKTDFSELSASFQLADGVARSKDLDMKSPFLRLGGEGAIDVGRSRIDYLTRATVAATSKGQDGAELAALKGLTVPVRVSGPLESVDWKIEWSAVARDAVTRELKDRLGEKLGLKPPAKSASAPSPQEALKNKLKGLFK